MNFSLLFFLTVKIFNKSKNSQTFTTYLIFKKIKFYGI